MKKILNENYFQWGTLILSVIILLAILFQIAHSPRCFEKTVGAEIFFIIPSLIFTLLILFKNKAKSAWIWMLLLGIYFVFMGMDIESTCRRFPNTYGEFIIIPAVIIFFSQLVFKTCKKK